jgi:ADP-heptose:LPS heptosyltransferase
MPNSASGGPTSPVTSDKPIKRVLVIKLGAMGDVVQATGPFAAIRRHHADAHITLLTTQLFRDFAMAGGWFDEVWVDDRPRWREIRGWIESIKRLRGGRFDRVYDLQTSDRTAIIFHLMGIRRKPEWCGTVPGCSHRHVDPRRDLMHTVERHAGQLAVAGIANVPPPTVDDISADIGRFGLPSPYVLLVPGGSPHRPDKLWPAGNYADLARRLIAKEITPVVIGGAAESQTASAIATFCVGARDLTGETSMADIVALARGAAGAVGNDTGPMHLIATAGTPSVALFSHASDPELCGQRGADVTILRRPSLDDLSVDEVEAALRLR